MATSAVRQALAVTVEKCNHVKDRVKIITSYPSTYKVGDIFIDVHPEMEKGYAIKAMGASTTSVGTDAFQLDWDLAICDLTSLFQLKAIRFVCTKTEEDMEEEDTAATTDTRRDAFQLLMNASNQRTLPAKKTSSSGVKSGLSRKDELYNNLLVDMEKKEVNFPVSTADSEGYYFLQTMYPCYHCPQKFRTKREMKAHYEENHQVKPQGDPPEDPSVLKRRLSSPDMEIERPPVPCTQLNPCPDHPQDAPVSCTQLNPCPDHPPVSSTQLDPCPNPPPIPYSLADARCQALAVLEEGRMPLVAAAPRLWSRDRQVILPGGIHWPPRGTAAMDSDLKLLHLEGAAMQLATWAGLPITGRRELLDTFRILSLPGTAYPPASTAVQRARDLMYEVVLQVAGGDLGDPTCLGLVQALLHTPRPAGLLQDIGQSLQGIGVDISH